MKKIKHVTFFIITLQTSYNKKHHTTLPTFEAKLVEHDFIGNLIVYKIIKYN